MKVSCTFKTSYKNIKSLINQPIGHFDSASLHLSVHLQANVHSSVNPCPNRYICRPFLHSLVTALFLFWSSPRPISTSQLHALLHFHPKPINLVVFKGSYSYDGISYLEGGFTLRCLQRLSLPDLATLLWAWQLNRYTSGLSIPVLSY